MSDPQPSTDPPFYAIADRLALGMAFQAVAPADGGAARFTYVSPRCLEMNGVAAAAVMADSEAFLGLLPPDHRARMRAAVQAASPNLEPLDLQIALVRPDG